MSGCNLGLDVRRFGMIFGKRKRVTSNPAKVLDNKDGRSFFREVFIRRGTTSGVYGVEEPHECYMTYTTERAEKEALKLYKRELRCSHQEAIEAYCRDWDASGISKSLTFAQKVNEAGRVLNLKAKQ